MSHNLETLSGVSIKPLFEDKTLPLVIQPEGKELLDFETFKNWFVENKPLLQKYLWKAGALLFRGFPIENPQAFEAMVSTYNPNLLNYIGGNSPRDLVTSKVYTSTSYPPSWRISLHNEVSYLLGSPSVLFLYCDTPPKSGGETPVSDCRTFLQKLDPEIKKKFVEGKVKYVQNFYDGILGKSWQKTFETEDKKFVEDFCEREKAEFTWEGEHNLKITYLREATIRHPETNEEVWFNQADQWHVSTLEPKSREFLLKRMKDDEIPHNAFYGDGTRISDEDIKRIQDLYYEQATYFSWEKNDLMLVDNILATHGRQPFEGPRKILVAMV